MMNDMANANPKGAGKRRGAQVLLLLSLAVLAFGQRSDGQPARPLADQLRLAGAMPRGAMVYVQARDLAGLMKTWMASSTRQKFYEGKSYAAFEQSRIFLKLKSRREDFQNAIGFELNEARLAEIAGGASALALYDIGDLEMVFVSEMPRTKALATALFRQAPQFQERSSEGGPYYVRDVTTDYGRLNQQFCFAYAGERLIVTTTEGLMVRTLANLRGGEGESLLADVLATASQVPGLATNDLTMWLDQARLNQNRYFANYWIHHNVQSELARMQSGLIDLRITPAGLEEHRYFTVTGEAQAAGEMSADQIAGLIGFAPASAQWIEARAGAAEEALSKALFEKLPDASRLGENIPDFTRPTSFESPTRVERYSRLDRRFEIDVDDAEAPGRGGRSRTTATAADQGRFLALAREILGENVEAYAEVARSKAEAGKPFVRFERGVVMRLRSSEGFDRARLEQAITEEMRRRYVVNGVDAPFEWQERGGVRAIAQALLEQGAAYTISGQYLIVASSEELATEMAQAGQARAARAASEPRPLTAYATVRLAAARPVFDTLFGKLEGKRTGDGDGEEESTDVMFFSENVSSLVAAAPFREVRVSRWREGALLAERLSYVW